MANHAIVVGIDKYWRPDFELKSCVEDAVSFARWLTNSKICRVLPQNLYLLTGADPSSPAPSVPLPPGITRMDARFSDLVTATNVMKQRSHGTGEKFFFYFSGHGLTNDSAIDAEDAIVMADFDHTFTDNALEIRSFMEYFKGTHFMQQFFIIDACRDVLDWGKDFRTREFTLVADEIDHKRPAVQQFSLLATSPRTRAAAIGTASAFTKELLDGLSGKGTAIALEPPSGEYVVSTSRLFKYVETQIAARKINVSKDKNNPVFQVPRINGEHGSNDPEWARLTAVGVAQATLNVFVNPGNAWKSTQVWVVDQFGDEKRRINPIQSLPEKLQLDPMIYTVRVLAPGYKAEQPKYSFELYEETNLNINLAHDVEVAAEKDSRVGSGLETKGGRGGFAGGDAETKGVGFTTKGVPDTRSGYDPDTEGVPGAGGDAGFEVVPLTPTMPAAESGTLSTLTVRASDNLARLEIADSQGNVLFTGQGRITKTLAPAFYRARLVTPEGQTVEMIVDLSPGKKEEVRLRAPQLTPQLLSTILALTGSVLSHDEKREHRFFSSSRGAASGSTSGLHILGGFESIGSEEVSDRLAGTRLRLWSIHEEQPESESGTLKASDFLGVYEFTQSFEPGQYFLSIELPEQPAVVFAVTVLPERWTMLVFHRDAGDQLRIFQYSLALLDEKKKLSPDELRRLELAQRFYLGGRLDYAYDTAKQLLRAKWVDPLAGCLGCYLLLRLGRANELRVAVNNLIGSYEQLCDSHVLKAEYETNAGDERAAKQSFERALDAGLPVFADGLTILSAAVERYQLHDHPHAELVRRMANKRVRGFLWTAWTPSKTKRPTEARQVIYNIGDSMNAGRDINKVNGDQIYSGRDTYKIGGDFIQHNTSGGQEDALDQIFSQLRQQKLALPQENHDWLDWLINETYRSARTIHAGNDSQESRAILTSQLLTLNQIAPDLARVAIEKLSLIGGDLNRVMTDIELKVSGNKK